MGEAKRLSTAKPVYPSSASQLVMVPMHRDPTLHQLIAELASKRGLRVEYDTHYDALNWEIRWWADDVLHALDIQPYPDGRIEVSRRRTRYPWLPRLVAWARNVIPMFPDVGRSTREPVATLAWPSESARLRDVVESELAQST
jgi:hypothetical protein